MKRVYLFLICFFCILSYNIIAQNKKSNLYYNYSLKELSELTVTTGSIKEENIKSAPSNVIIITHQMIEERGYNTLIDVCQDIPGFDFLMFNDASGGYSTYNMNRGMGNVGNPEILIMIDGVVQNSISYNWSQLWKYENTFIDIERIEIIQGPGSVMYGAQAFTGIIHLITKKEINGIEAQVSYGSNYTYATDIFAVTKLSQNTNFSIAFHNYSSQGDDGENRYDPGYYFKNIRRPTVILKDYDNNGIFLENTNNPRVGEYIKDGFNTNNNSYAIRSKITHKNTELGFFLSEYKRGYGSTVLAYEYDLRDKENTIHSRNYHIFCRNNYQINPKIFLKSTIVYRVTNMIPDGGFKYLYRFPHLRKSYGSYAFQSYLEENLLIDINANNDISIAFKASFNNEGSRISSLGKYPTSKNSTSSSWDIAVNGGGLNQVKKYDTHTVKEGALYALWDHQFKNTFSSSIGIRYDYNSEFKSIFTPRFALVFTPIKELNTKLLFGTAFRKPSIYELYDEFRGNPNLKPQKINTTEIELSSILFNDGLLLKLNSYYSVINNLIEQESDPQHIDDGRFLNIGKKKLAGLSFNMDLNLKNNFRLYSNYSFLTGIENNTNEFYQLDHTAKHKVNTGLNIKLLEQRLTSDFRINYVGKRKAPLSNKWLQTYKNGFAPSYLKANWVILYKFTPQFMSQLILNNIFNEKFYGIGRESGSGFIDEYDYINNVNPNGFIPAYHPQPKRTVFLKLIYKI